MAETENPQSEVDRAKATVETLYEGLAPAFAGRLCPFKASAPGLAGSPADPSNRECDGPRCMLFACFDDHPDPAKPGRVSNGACSYVLSSQQLNMMAVGFDGLARSLSNVAMGTRILK